MSGIGRESFTDLLAGLHTMDEHFRTAPFTAKHAGPARAARACGAPTASARRPTRCCRTAAPLRQFPAYLQQLTMESTGTRVRRDGSPVTSTTGEIYWGEPAPTASAP